MKNAYQYEKYNAFNRYNDYQYKYQNSDISAIGKQLMSGSFIHEIGKSSNYEIDKQHDYTAFEIFKKYKEIIDKGEKKIGIYNTEGNHWIAFVIIKLDHIIHCIYKDSLGSTTIDDFENDIKIAFGEEVKFKSYKGKEQEDLKYYKGKENFKNEIITCGLFALKNAVLFSTKNTLDELIDISLDEFFNPATAPEGYESSIQSLRQEYAIIYAKNIYESLKSSFQDKLYRQSVISAHQKEVKELERIFIQAKREDIKVEVRTQADNPSNYFYCLECSAERYKETLNCLGELLGIQTNLINAKEEDKKSRFKIEPGYIQEKTAFQLYALIQNQPTILTTELNTKDLKNDFIQALNIQEQITDISFLERITKEFDIEFNIWPKNNLENKGNGPEYIIFIKNLFNKEFEKFIQQEGSSVKLSIRVIKKRLLKIDITSLEKKIELEEFETILAKGRELLLELQRKNTKKNKSDIQKDIFLSIGLCAKLVIYQQENEDSIKDIITSFQRFYDLIKLSYVVKSSKDLISDIKQTSSYSDISEESNDFFCESTEDQESKKLPNTKRNNSYMPGQLKQNLKNIWKDLSGLMNIFIQEFASFKNNKDFKMKRFNLFIDWHLDGYFLERLNFYLLEISKYLNHQDTVEAENQKNFYRCILVCYIIVNDKLSKRIQEYLKNNDLYLTFRLDNNISNTTNFTNLYLKLNAYETSNNLALFSRVKKENIGTLINALDDMLDIMVAPLKNEHKSLCTMKFGKIISSFKILENKLHAPTSDNDPKELPNDPKELPNDPKELPNPAIIINYQNLEFKEKYKLNINIIKEIEDIYDNFNNTKSTPAILEFYILVFYSIIDKLLSSPIEKNNLNEELKQSIYKILNEICLADNYFIFNHLSLLKKILLISTKLKENMLNIVHNTSINKSCPYYINLQHSGFLPLRNFEWEIPNFAIIFGVNGVGKTRLLNYLNNKYNVQLNIDANHLQEIDLALGETLRNITRSKNLTFEEVCIYINNSGAFPLSQGSHTAYEFPIITFLYIEYLIIKENKNLEITGNIKVKEFINSLLERHFVGFIIKECYIDENQKFQILFEKEGKDIFFYNLSSGEKVLFTLVSCAVSNKIVEQVLEIKPSRLLLFDEVDIHFHPEYCKKFFDIIKNDLEHENTYIIMTTHNPATIALAEQYNKQLIEEKQKVKFYNLKQLESKTEISEVSTARQAISYLSKGLMNVVADKNLVLVESQDDVSFYTMLSKKFDKELKEGSSISNCFTKLIFLSAGVKLEAHENIIERINDLNIPDEKMQKLFSDIVKALRSNEYMGGKDQVRHKVFNLSLEYILGAIDKDKGNEPSKGVHVLPRAYSIENYLCCPINILLLLKKKKYEGKHTELYAEVIKKMNSNFINNLPDLSIDNREMELQNTINIMCEAFFKVSGNKQQENNVVQIETIGGLKLNYPQWWMEEQGHNLVRLIRKAFLQEVEQVNFRTKDLLESYEKVYPMQIISKELKLFIESLINSIDPAPTINPQQLLPQEVTDKKTIIPVFTEQGQGEYIFGKISHKFSIQETIHKSDVKEYIEKYLKKHKTINNIKQQLSNTIPSLKEDNLTLEFIPKQATIENLKILFKFMKINAEIEAYQAEGGTKKKVFLVKCNTKEDLTILKQCFKKEKTSGNSHKDKAAAVREENRLLESSKQIAPTEIEDKKSLPSRPHSPNSPHASRISQEREQSRDDSRGI
ncbi:AAA family ATPase [Candidatus Jidaibacter acanthamoebae]|nr:AAA family ATPase [Candidatus Jidaibacter acanthamoeba]